MQVKRAIEKEDFILDSASILEFTNLGAGNEVGRSCHVIQFKGKTVMLDAGVHPAYNGLAAFPFYDEIDLSTVDILLISHFHVDHVASLPYVMTKTNFKGRVFMTHPTKAIYKWLLTDFLRVSNSTSEEQLYEEKDLIKSLEKIEVVDYHSTVEVNGVKFTPYHAGHVLGAAMFFIEVAGIKILFTGDYSREEDRHLIPAELPPIQPDILITESTYGTASHQPIAEKELRLTRGRVLIPVFALGRTQELMLIIDEYWHNHPELHSIPVYYACSLAKKCMTVYQTYINTMNNKIRKVFEQRNPFIFRYISSLKSLDQFEDIGPCVMLASPGMLQSGVSRALLEKWCPDPKNGLIVAGYCVEGTMAKHILNEPSEIISLSGQKIPRRMTIEEISFEAHVDYIQNSQFIDLVNANHIILVHGEQNNMGRLKSALLSKYSHRKDEVHIYNPKNCETLKLIFKEDKIAKTIGHIAKTPPENDHIISGIMVQKDFQISIMSSDDLKEFTGLTTSIIMQRQTLSFHASIDVLHYHLEQMFGAIEDQVDENNNRVFKVMNIVSIKCLQKNIISLEWPGNALNDTIADTVLAIILAAENSPVSVKTFNSDKNHCLYTGFDCKEKKNRIEMFLKSQFGQSLVVNDDIFEIHIDQHVAKINLETFDVECTYEPLRSRVSHVLGGAISTITPFVDPFTEIDSKITESSFHEDQLELNVKKERQEEFFPLVRTSDELLERYKNETPSLVLHMYPTHFRFEQQDGVFLYNSPMRIILEYIRMETIPPDLRDHRQSSNDDAHSNTNKNTQTVNEHVIPSKSPSRSFSAANVTEKVYYTVLKPSSETIWAEMCLFSESTGGKFNDDMSIEFESQILIATTPILYLQPAANPMVMSKIFSELYEPMLPVMKKRKQSPKKMNEVKKEEQFMLIMDEKQGKSFQPSFARLAFLEKFRHKRSRIYHHLNTSQIYQRQNSQAASFKIPENDLAMQKLQQRNPALLSYNNAVMMNPLLKTFQPGNVYTKKQQDLIRTQKAMLQIRTMQLKQAGVPIQQINEIIRQQAAQMGIVIQEMPMRAENINISPSMQHAYSLQRNKEHTDILGVKKTSTDPKI
ncbi:hypothetical protein PCANB_001798 [Pneumocystis canis]|nr:hypothetical protein PCANB_001798 [Pneumocystis canis]